MRYSVPLKQDTPLRQVAYDLKVDLRRLVQMNKHRANMQGLRQTSKVKQDSVMLFLSEYTTSLDGDTPEDVASVFGVDVERLIRLNAPWYEGLHRDMVLQKKV